MRVHRGDSAAIHPHAQNYEPWIGFTRQKERERERGCGFELVLVLAHMTAFIIRRLQKD